MSTENRTQEILRKLKARMGDPRNNRKEPMNQHGTLYASIDKDAWVEAGVDPDNPDEWEEIWLPKEDIVAFNLNPED